MSEEYEIPEELYYSREHEWLKIIDENTVEIGVTHFAAIKLESVVYVELPEVGQEVKQMEPFATIESVKTTADVFSPISGTIKEVNRELEDSPELINEDPYGKGWIARVEPSNLDEDLKNLMKAEEYREFLKEEE